MEPASANDAAIVNGEINIGENRAMQSLEVQGTIRVGEVKKEGARQSMGLEQLEEGVSYPPTQRFGQRWNAGSLVAEFTIPEAALSDMAQDQPPSDVVEAAYPPKQQVSGLAPQALAKEFHPDSEVIYHPEENPQEDVGMDAHEAEVSYPPTQKNFGGSIPEKDAKPSEDGSRWIPNDVEVAYPPTQKSLGPNGDSIAQIDAGEKQNDNDAAWQPPPTPPIPLDAWMTPMPSQFLTFYSSYPAITQTASPRPQPSALAESASELTLNILTTTLTSLTTNTAMPSVCQEQSDNLETYFNGCNSLLNNPQCRTNSTLQELANVAGTIFAQCVCNSRAYRGSAGSACRERQCGGMTNRFCNATLLDAVSDSCLNVNFTGVTKAFGYYLIVNRTVYIPEPSPDLLANTLEFCKSGLSNAIHGKHATNAVFAMALVWTAMMIL
ncbi:hypothetical protein HDU67_001659, partial [Dinochytrium kinnereticum]